MLRSFDIFRKATLGLALAEMASLGAAHAASVKVLHDFKGGEDGAQPIAGLISDREGNLFGTTAEGGGSGCGGGLGCGTVFELTPDGVETVLYAFQGGAAGEYPVTSLVRDKGGNLYGITGGGNGENCQEGCGTVFRLAPDGTLTILHAFSGGRDGAYPEAGLLLDNLGNLYGTTFGGGANSEGTVFKVTPNGAESVIYAFCAQTKCMDGASPKSALIADQAGNLYGTTEYGGDYGNGNTVGGTVFRIAPNGGETVLYSFCQAQPECTDGSNPYAGVTMDKAGNLYGTTHAGGVELSGAVFKLAPGGTETVLHSFDYTVDGYGPTSGVIVDKAGAIYGTLPFDTVCKSKLGLVYRISPGGGEKFYCIRSLINAGVIQKNDHLYGTGWTGGKYGEGFVFAIEKD